MLFEEKARWTCFIWSLNGRLVVCVISECTMEIQYIVKGGLCSGVKMNMIQYLLISTHICHSYLLISTANFHCYGQCQMPSGLDCGFTSPWRPTNLFDPWNTPVPIFYLYLYVGQQQSNGLGWVTFSPPLPTYKLLIWGLFDDIGVCKGPFEHGCSEWEEMTAEWFAWFH